MWRKTVLALVCVALSGCLSSRPGASDLSLEEARAILTPNMPASELQMKLGITPKQVGPGVLKWELEDGDLLTNFGKDERSVLVIKGEVKPDPGAVPPIPPAPKR